MNSFMNSTGPNNFRLNRSASMPDLERFMNNTSLQLNMLTVNSSHFEQGDPIARNFSCNNLHSPRRSNSTFQTLDSPYQNQSSNWTNSQLDLLSPIVKTNNLYFCKESNYNGHRNVSNNLHNVKYFGQFENYDFHFEKVCNEKMSTYENMENPLLLRNDHLRFEETPMDVDKSLESPKINIRSNEESGNQSKTKRKSDYDLQMDWQGIEDDEICKIKKRKIHLNAEEHHSKKKRKCTWVKHILKFLVLLTIIYSVQWAAPLYDSNLGAVENIIKISSLISGTQMKYCRTDYDTSLLEKDMREKLYGQNDVIKHLPDYLHFNNNFQLIVFTGGTGVGKSFVKNMIMNTFLWKSNIRQFFTMHNLSKRRQTVQLFNSLSTCGYNLIVIDDLYKDDINNVIDLAENLYTISTNKKMKTILILIYNIQEITPKGHIKVDVDGGTNEIVQEVRKRFETYFEPKVLKFQTLKLKSLIKCVNAVAKTISVRVPKEVVEEIALNLGDFGCKNAEKKVLLWRTQHYNLK